MISQTAEYALRTIVWLAGQDGAPQTTRTIAEATRVPPGYLSKILQNLGKAGLVTAQRGLHGGYVLAGDPEKISPLDVIDAIDPIRRIEHCPLGLESHGTELCPLHRRLDDALASIQDALARSTIAELLNEPARSRPFCD